MTAPREEAWRAVAGGLELRVKAQPGARRAGLMGLVPGVDGPRLKVAVREPPLEFRANRAIVALLADAMEVPVGHVSITQGETAREKTIRVDGDAGALADRLSGLLAPPLG